MSGVEIARGQDPGQGYVGRNLLTGINVDYGLFGEITGALDSRRLEQTVICASSLIDPDSGRAELPIERALRAPVGAFDVMLRHFNCVQ